MAEVNKRFVNAYMDSSLSLFWDVDMTRPINQTLYKRDGDPRLYIDEALSIELNTIFIEAGPSSETQQQAGSSSITSIGTGQEGSSDSCLSASQTFTHENTLFLIHLMRNYLTENNENLPKSLHELAEKVRQGRGKRSVFWQDISDKLQMEFKLLFDPKKVARKWDTLIEGYKKTKDNNNATGRGKMKFQYFTEIDQLIGNNHDIVFPVVGTAHGVSIVRPDALLKVPPPQQAPEDTSPTPTPTPSRKRKGHHDVVDFLKEAEERAAKRHQEHLDEVRASRESFERMMQAFLAKL